MHRLALERVDLLAASWMRRPMLTDDDNDQIIAFAADSVVKFGTKPTIVVKTNSTWWKQRIEPLLDLVMTKTTFWV